MILLTGATGFIGKSLLQAPQDYDYQVTTAVRNRDSLSKKSIKLDITDMPQTPS